MMLPRPDASLSRSALAFACGWWLLPGSPWGADAPSAEAGGGTAVHRPLAALVNGGVLELPEAWELRCMYARARARLIELGLVGPGRPQHGVRGEVAFAFDVATREARELANVADEEDPRWYADPAKRYGMRPTEIGTRLDVVGLGSDELGPFALYVELKCHFSPEMKSAAEQLRAGGAVLGLATGAPRVKLLAIHVWADHDELEELPELGPDEIEAEARALVRLFTPEPGTPAVSGPHCTERFCPAASTCPEAMGAAEHALDVVPVERLTRGRWTFSEAATTHEHAAWKLTAIKLARKVLDAQEEEVKALADELGEIQLGDGWTYGGRPQPREMLTLEVLGALEIMQARGLDFAIEQSTSLTAIAAVAGEDVAEAVRLELRAIGATRQTMGRAYTTRKPETAKAKPPKRARRAKGAA